MQELVKALEWIAEDAPNYLRRYGALYPKPASEMQAVALKALATHKANPALSEEELIKLLILKTTSTRYKQNTNGKCWTFVDLNTFAATLIVDIIEALRDAGVLNVRGE